MNIECPGCIHWIKYITMVFWTKLTLKDRCCFNNWLWSFARLDFLSLWVYSVSDKLFLKMRILIFFLSDGFHIEWNKAEIQVRLSSGKVWTWVFSPHYFIFTSYVGIQHVRGRFLWLRLTEIGLGDKKLIGTDGKETRPGFLRKQSKKLSESPFNWSCMLDYPDKRMNLFIFRTSCSAMFSNRTHDLPHSPLYSLV